MNLLDPHFRRALVFARPHAGSLAAVLALSLLGAALGLVVPYLSKPLVDNALLAGDVGALGRIIGLLLGVTALWYATNAWTGIRCTRVSADILSDMRLYLYRHLQALSPRFYASTPLDDVVARIDGDMHEIQRITSEAALRWPGQMLALGCTVGILLWMGRFFPVVGNTQTAAEIKVFNMYTGVFQDFNQLLQFAEGIHERIYLG